MLSPEFITFAHTYLLGLTTASGIFLYALTDRGNQKKAFWFWAALLFLTYVWSPRL